MGLRGCIRMIRSRGIKGGESGIGGLVGRK